MGHFGHSSQEGKGCYGRPPRSLPSNPHRLETPGCAEGDGAPSCPTPLLSPGCTGQLSCQALDCSQGHCRCHLRPHGKKGPHEGACTQPESTRKHVDSSEADQVQAACFTRDTDTRNPHQRGSRRALQGGRARDSKFRLQKGHEVPGRGGQTYFTSLQKAERANRWRLAWGRFGLLLKEACPHEAGTPRVPSPTACSGFPAAEDGGLPREAGPGDPHKAPSKS